MDLVEATRELRETVLREARAFRGRALLAAEGFRQNEGEPFRVLRVARTTAHILEQMPIRIRPGEVLVGWHPSTEADAEASAAIDEATAYLRTQTYWVGASEGHMSVDNPTVLSTGLTAVGERISEGREALVPTDPKTPERRAFYDAAEISLGALQGLIGRYAELAREMAETTDDDAWRGELLATSERCEWLAKGPARTFHEAIQLMWFLFLGVAIEGGDTHGCFGPGRMDQYMNPYLERDRERGLIDDVMLHTLLDQLFIKCNEFHERSMSAVITVVAGRKPDGSDGTNPLSFELLEASDRVQMYFPGIDVSWHPDMDPEFMRRAVALLRNGKGQPAFFNSDVIAKGLVNHGVLPEHAVDHLPSTCTETSVMGRTNPWVAWPYVNIPMCLLYALFDGQHPINGTQDRPAMGTPETYEEVKSAFLRQVEWAADDAVARGLREQLLESWYRPFPLLSCFIQGCIESGADISHGGALYNFLQPEAVGVSNVIDGLVAIKVLTETDKSFALDDFRKAVRANFENYEELQRAILKECPKYGNDTDWINDLFAEVTGTWCSALEKHRNRFDGPVLPGFLGWVVWIGFGEQTPATPDGRLAGTPLANSLAPCTGVAVKGTPSMVLSASKLDHSRGLGGMTFNVRFGASSIRTDEGLDRLGGLIEGSMEVGTYMVQVNLASVETMRAAQETPGDFADLFVRIGGYLVPFTLLPENAQEEVIARTELDL